MLELIQFKHEHWESCYQDWFDIDTQRGFNFIPTWHDIAEYIKLMENHKYIINAMISDNGIICGHITVSDKEYSDIAVWIFKKYRKRGIAKSAIINLINELRERLKCSYLYAGIYKENDISMHLFRELGFEYYGQGEIEREIFTGKETYQVIYKKELVREWNFT